MTKNIDYIINYSEGLLSERKMRKFEEKLQLDKDLKEEYNLFCELNEFMKAKADLEEVRNDPALKTIDPLIYESVRKFHRDKGRLEESRNFITDALKERMPKKTIKEDIGQIKKEIEALGINELSESWVKEWTEKNQDQKNNDPQLKEIRDYITLSMKSGKGSPGLKIAYKRQEDRKTSLILRYAGLSAAVIIAGAMLFRVLMPLPSPEKVYREFYEPMTAISPVTRGNNSGTELQYTEAIEMYRQGNYIEASKLFVSVMQNDPSNAPAYFFNGLTQLETGNYPAAISCLTFAADHPNEFLREAQWYLGLALLASGDETKAIPLFKTLSETDGYYKNRAVKVLRRLR